MLLKYPLQIIYFIYYTIEYIFEILYATIYGYGTNYIENSIKTKFGLDVKVHLSTTKDGCIIKTHQLLPKIKNENNEKLIFCQHGKVNEKNFLNFLEKDFLKQEVLL